MRDRAQIPPLNCSSTGREVKPKTSSLSRLGIYVKKSLVLFDDAVHGSKPQPSALPQFLGREKGLENSVKSGFVHSGSSVRNREHHIRSGCGVWMSSTKVFVNLGMLRFDDQLPTQRHCVAGV